MAARIATTLIGLPLLFLLLFPGGAELFAGAVAVVCFLGLREFYRGCGERGIRPVAEVGFAATGALLLWATPWGGARLGPYLGGVMAALVVVAFLRELARAKRAPVTNLGATLLGVVYVGWLFSHLVLLRADGAGLLVRLGGAAPRPLAGGIAGDAGAWLVLFVVLTTWASDTAAYFVGRAVGRRRLAPEISPGKTVEGAAGGLLAALLAAGLLGTALGLAPAPGLLLGLLVGVVGAIGDLCESALKRDLGLKDFGALLPGHGGVLDRFDSLLFTAPAIYYALMLWPS